MLNYSTPLDLVFHALADPARRVMVERLSRGPATVSDLARPLGMSLPGVVQHIKVLEESGLVSSVKVGRVRTCRVEEKSFAAAERWFAERRAFWERTLDRLGDYLDRQAGAADVPPSPPRSHSRKAKSAKTKANGPFSRTARSKP